MDQTTTWWLHHTSAGRRTLDRMLPASAIPRNVRDQICAEQGHAELGDGSCRRCGATVTERRTHGNKNRR